MTRPATRTDRRAVGVKAAAEMYGVSTDTIHKAIKAAEPPYLRAKKIGGRISIRVADLDSWHDSLPDA